MCMYYTINYTTNDKYSEEQRNSWDTLLALQGLQKLKLNVEKALYYYKNIFLIFIIRYNIFTCYTESYSMCMGELLFEDPNKTFFTVRNYVI